MRVWLELTAYYEMFSKLSSTEDNSILVALKYSKTKVLQCRQQVLINTHQYRIMVHNFKALKGSYLFLQLQKQKYSTLYYVLNVKSNKKL